MGKKSILMWAMVVLMVIVSSGIAEEKKSKEQIMKELKERWRAEKEKKENAKIQLIPGKEVQFLDDTRKVHKKVSLETESVIETETAQIGNTKKTNRVKREIMKHAVMNSDYKFVAININKVNKWLINEKGEETYIEDGYATGRVKYMDEQGNLLWDKSLPTGRFLEGEPLISENGETVAVIGDETINIFEVPSLMVFVYDKKGNEIKRIPSEDEMDMGKVLRLNKISPNGKYFAISIMSEKGTINRFYNLRNKKHWELSKTGYFVFGISDDGIAKVDMGGESPTEYLDLKQYVGD